MKQIRTEDAVGQVLCHDITRIIRGVEKGAVLRKGHIIREEDISVLLDAGKEHVYIWEYDERMLHENEAAKILYEICKGKHVHGSEIREGKIELIADCDGVLKIDVLRMNRVNALGNMMIASRHGNFPVQAGDKLAGTRIIPLVIERERMEEARQAAMGQPIFHILPYQNRRVGIVTTGSEVYSGRIQDSFTPVIREKLAPFPAEIAEHILCGDEQEKITDAILYCVKQGADMIICTGGMSVDPDDRTPLAIKCTGAEIVTYGAPVLPGAMFLLAYLEKSIPVMGLPGCVMYAGRTIFDLVLPRIMAGEILTQADFTQLGQGGLCLSCEICTFPDCGFGK